MDIKPPYWVAKSDDLPALDFNREIVAPGLIDVFPEGAIGVRVDDDFWSVAALPFEKYRNVPIQDIVAEFWPDIMTKAEFNPDSECYIQGKA